MTDSPDQIRADIEKTRRELGGDVDALADKVSPSKIVDRQTDKVKHAFGSVRDKVMGAADDTGTAISDAGSSVAEHVGDAKDKVVAKAEGNPLAVGLIAFGVACSRHPSSPLRRRRRRSPRRSRTRRSRSSTRSPTSRRTSGRTSRSRLRMPRPP